ncbi:MAG: carboxypeptidase-like regulatory domain-containing protein [Desulfarculaceae bacterium]|nr:carboxypeptidase-like regulatory domain-containing protein [Desulfarculaceae bacterium]MCF8073580.1 carboxypeptidase-like regulatory domain-containing protein [Desulfarculaceae bacterium]MCF8103102.1 carboxypeptidase-like regulatory domain-containing protein [Desulfarculaceae bacterium]MCF8115704.1 carboxypeptidase-like regulatory domain-containing protein [Desulfarculaceae bacterium]
MHRALISLLLLAVLILPAAFPAQAETAGSISGAVVNRYGEPIKGAAVRAEHLQEGFVVESLTDGKGTYVITNLSAGDYKLEASAGRKASVAVEKTKLASGQNKTLNFVINVKEGLRIDPNYRPTEPGLLN